MMKIDKVTDIETDEMPYELPKGWILVKLEGIIDILDGKRIPVNSDEREKRIANKSQTELYPYYGATGQVGFIDDYIFDEELVLLGEDGAPFLESSKNKAYIIKGKTWVNNHAHVLKAIKKITLNLFLCHYFNFFDYHGYVTGTTRLKLNQSLMRTIPIPLPPLPEQHRIVAKIEELFTKLDAGVASLKKVQAQLKQYRQAVLKSAVEGKLTAEWRAIHKDELEPASVLLERIRKEKNKDSKYSGSLIDEDKLDTIADLPDLPDGWEWVDIGTLFNTAYGLSESLSKTIPDNELDVPVLRIPNIKEFGGLDLSKLKYFPLDKAKRERLAVKKGDILFNWRNAPKWIGRSAVFDRDDDFVNASFLLKSSQNIWLFPYKG